MLRDRNCFGGKVGYKTEDQRGRGCGMQSEKLLDIFAEGMGLHVLCSTVKM